MLKASSLIPLVQRCSLMLTMVGYTIPHSLIVQSPNPYFNWSLQLWFLLSWAENWPVWSKVNNMSSYSIYLGSDCNSAQSQTAWLVYTSSTFFLPALHPLLFLLCPTICWVSLQGVSSSSEMPQDEGTYKQWGHNWIPLLSLSCQQAEKTMKNHPPTLT